MKGFLTLLVLALTAASVFGEMYTWKDRKGTAFYTNSLHEIPARYLKRARVLDVATGKVGGLATAQPATPGTATAAAPAAAAQPQPMQTAAPTLPPLSPAPLPASTPAPAAPTRVSAPAPGIAEPVPNPPAAAEAVAQRPQQGSSSLRESRSQRRRSSSQRGEE